jgi:hypothetical protein
VRGARIIFGGGGTENSPADLRDGSRVFMLEDFFKILLTLVFNFYLFLILIFFVKGAHAWVLSHPPVGSHPSTHKLSRTLKGKPILVRN